MNMFKASFDTEQNYPYIYNTTTKKIHTQIQFIIIFFKVYTEKNEHNYFTKKNLLLLLRN